MIGVHVQSTAAMPPKDPTVERTLRRLIDRLINMMRALRGVYGSLVLGQGGVTFSALLLTARMVSDSLTPLGALMATARTELATPDSHGM